MAFSLVCSLLITACEACCQESPSVQCANVTAPLGQVGKGKPLILVMQLGTPNLWNSFCRYTAAVNAQWAKRMGHRYLLTGGEYLGSNDLWRGGNIRAVLQVMRQVEEVDWIFHLDCDAALVDFSQDALTHIIEQRSEEIQVFLSRDESGFAGTSRLSNMGTGLWRRSTWTLQLLESWWQALDTDSKRNEQEVLEHFLTTNKDGCLKRLVLLPAGLLNSESSNPIAAPASRQHVVHLAGMPNAVRTDVFKSLWQGVCGSEPLEDWLLRELLITSLNDFSSALPDAPRILDSDWTRMSESSRVARRLALLLLRGGTHREEADLWLHRALHRTLLLEEKLQGREAFALPLAHSLENLAGPLLELGHYQEAQSLLLRPRLVPRQSLDEALHAENLAACFQHTGRVAESQVLVHGALKVMEDAFPPEVKDVRPAGTRARLAQILHLQGRSNEAVRLLRKALKEYERSMGKGHPQTLNCARNLAVLLKQSAGQNRKSELSEAEALLKRAALGYAKVLGAEHPESQRFQRNLANFRHWRRRVHPEL